MDATKGHQPLCFDPQQLWQRTWQNCCWGEDFTHLPSPHLPLAEFTEIWFHFGIPKSRAEA